MFTHPGLAEHGRDLDRVNRPSAVRSSCQSATTPSQMPTCTLPVSFTWPRSRPTSTSCTRGRPTSPTNVLVLNVGGYPGQSTRREINYCHRPLQAGQPTSRPSRTDQGWEQNLAAMTKPQASFSV